MEGSSRGNGAAWPLPNVTTSAILHALRRASLAEVHNHTVKRSGKILADRRERQFGSLQCAGPFPIHSDGSWLFPRPADAQESGTSRPTHQPLTENITGANSNLSARLLSVVSNVHPSKQSPEPWLTRDAFEAYLRHEGLAQPGHYLRDEALFGAEQQIGIGIDPDTEAQDGERFYSASYLRLRENIHLGLIATCMDRVEGESIASRDLISETFPNSDKLTRILAGGQQRICTVSRHSPQRLPLPLGAAIEGTRVRWTLLTAAIFPQIPANSEKRINQHPGGWLPTWIDADMQVQLKNPLTALRQPKEGREQWRKRVASLPPIEAKLVAASIPRPIPVTGWALHDTDEQTGNLIATGGARATHLAVPAGAVYYFEASTPEAAQALAQALNWHGDTNGSEIQNRRSTLMGEKGFGLGVCSTWIPYSA